MKRLAIGVLMFTSAIMLTGCCNSGCGGGSVSDYSYTTSCCGAVSSCCGSGGW